MNILYIGDVRPGGTCLDRLGALQRLGHHLTPFNVIAYESRFRVVSSVQHRLHPRFLVQSLNDGITRFVEQNKGFDCAWIDKGVWIFPETVVFLKQHCKMVIHYTPDPQLLFHRSRHFVAALPAYDHIVTTKGFEVDLYRQASARHVILVPQSYCPVRYANPLSKQHFLADVGFIGRCEKHYLNQVNQLAGLGRIAVFGDQWIRKSNRALVDPDFSVSVGLWQADYVNALASFKIGLGLLSRLIPEQHTTRTFEIPAAGTFLLAERTAEHQGFFEEGREAEFFSSPEELRSKVQYYLQNDLARQKIALLGKKRCFSSGYDMDSVMQSILSQVH